MFLDPALIGANMLVPVMQLPVVESIAEIKPDTCRTRKNSRSGELPQPVDKNGAPGRTRTASLLIRSQMLYPIELRAQLKPTGPKDRLTKGGTLIKPAVNGKRPAANFSKIDPEATLCHGQSPNTL